MKDTLQRFNPRNTTSIGKYVVILFFTVFTCTIPTLYADDQTPTPDLYIESKTVDTSANCVIQGTDPEQDKKRTEIGVGETVNLELKGKRLGEVTSVTWKIVPDGNGASVEATKDDVKKAVLTANKNSTTDSNATVQVTTNIDSGLNPSGPRQKTFHIRVPSNIKGRHSGMRVEGYPLDGDKNIPGASTQLVMILSPLSVTFQNIFIKEKAHTGDGHDAGTGYLRINNRNESWCDRVGRKIPDGYTVESPGIQNHPVIGRDDSWSCGWYTYADEQFCCHIRG